MIILCAEDDGEDFEFFEEAIRQIDPEIVLFRARTGLEVLELLNHSVVLPDVIFLDINMPAMNGQACFTELQKDEKFKSIPVIVYSTSKDKKEISHFQSRGARFLVKPNEFNHLVSSLEVLLGYSDGSEIQI